MQTRIEELIAQLSRLKDRYHDLKYSPKTRESAFGGIMIHEAKAIQEMEDLDDKIKALEVEIYLLTNEDQTERIELVISEHYVYEVKIQNGVLISGGLLDNYFAGKLSEHHVNYAMSHRCRVFRLHIDPSSIVFEKKFDKNVVTGHMKFQCKLGLDLYEADTDFEIRSMWGFTPAKFRFTCQRYKFSKVGSTRGIGNKEKLALKHVAGIIYNNFSFDKLNLQIE